MLQSVKVEVKDWNLRQGLFRDVLLAQQVQYLDLTVGYDTMRYHQASPFVFFTCSLHQILLKIHTFLLAHRIGLMVLLLLILTLVAFLAHRLHYWLA